MITYATLLKTGYPCVSDATIIQQDSFMLYYTLHNYMSILPSDNLPHKTNSDDSLKTAIQMGMSFHKKSSRTNDSLSNVMKQPITKGTIN